MQKLLNRIVLLERWLCMSAFAILILIIFADVLSREISGAGIFWAHEVGVFANIVVVLMGFGLATSQAQHLRPRFADTWLPQAWQPRIMVAGLSFSALFCIMAAVVAAQVVNQTFALQERSLVLQLSIWPLQALLPISLLLAAARFLIFARYPQLRPTERSSLVPRADNTGASP
jgi:C4-dicarboxylate transporter DctQ subunit